MCEGVGEGVAYAAERIFGRHFESCGWSICGGGSDGVCAGGFIVLCGFGCVIDLVLCEVDG